MWAGRRLSLGSFYFKVVNVTDVTVYTFSQSRSSIFNGEVEKLQLRRFVSLDGGAHVYYSNTTKDVLL